MIGCTRALPAALVVAAFIAGAPAQGQDSSSSFNAGWDDPNWVINSRAERRPPLVAPATTGSTETGDDGGPGFQLGSSEVRLESVGGKPGATLTPQGGTIQLGVGLSPRPAGEVNPVAGFGALPPDEQDLPGFENGVAGALSFSDTRGPITQSLSLSAPLSDGGQSAPAGAPESGFKTMFGLGYNF